LSKTISQALSGTSASGAASANVFQMATDFTVALVPAVEVLSVQNPPVDTTSGRAANGSSMYVLNMVPDDAQELIFATEHATIYIGLLPPGNEAGYAEPGIVGVPLGRVIGVDK